MKLKKFLHFNNQKQNSHEQNYPCKHQIRFFIMNFAGIYLLSVTVNQANYKNQQETKCKNKAPRCEHNNYFRNKVILLPAEFIGFTHIY